MEFSKSTKSHERQAAIQFLYYCSFYFSIETFQEYKLGEKFLCFASDKFIGVKLLFAKYLERMQYFLTREEKIEMAIIIGRLVKEGDPELGEVISEMDLSEKDEIRQVIIEESKSLKEKEKLQAAIAQYNPPNKSLVLLNFM